MAEQKHSRKKKRIIKLTPKERKLLDILPDVKKKLSLDKLIKEIAQEIKIAKKETPSYKSVNYTFYDIRPKDFLSHHIIQKAKNILEIKQYKVSLYIECPVCQSNLNKSPTFECKKICKKEKPSYEARCYMTITWW